MTYRVEFSVRALHDLDVLYFEKNVAESAAAARWFSGLQDAVESLSTLPDRCPIAPEGRSRKREIRHLIYGEKPHVYRVIYEVDKRLKLVKVFHIRHGARQPLSPNELA